jgi:hypothetical protein
MSWPEALRRVSVLQENPGDAASCFRPTNDCDRFPESYRSLFSQKNRLDINPIALRYAQRYRHVITVHGPL